MPAATLVNRTFANHVIRDLIGAGGIAEVFRAVHVDDQRSVAALKIMRPERGAEPRHVRDFEHEFALLKQLQHPGIPSAKRAGELDGRPCMLIGFFPGRTLAAEVAGGSVDRSPRTFVQVVDVVAHLHGLGIVHNDLKLENILHDADTGRLGVVDFGNAREPIKTSLFRRFLPKPKTVFGSVTYIAPELTAGHQPTFASDVYALGICAFQLFAGSLPFAARATQRVRKSAAPIRAIREHLPQLSAGAAKAIDACLDPRPMARPRDAGELRSAIAEMESMGAAAMTRRVHAQGQSPNRNSALQKR
ncbi:MAG: serine/threonine protein kinase [Planctomycetes bacterium]|nr:serine/threonine protein kinase [Planctomycetota bacterium]